MTIETAEVASEHQLEITRTLDASTKEVFEAWTDPTIMAKWMGPGEITCKNVEVNLKVGGKYRIHMISEDGDHIAIGEYKSINPHSKLQYTWAWEGQEMPETMVTLTFKDNAGKTDLGILHKNFSSAEAAENHNMGWNGAIEKLTAYLN